MVQAARNGVQNIAEGSEVSATSRKTELKLTNVARASLEELRLDYEDYLRQRNLPKWPPDDPRRQDLVDLRPQTADDVAQWVRAVHDAVRSGGPDGPGGPSGHSGPARTEQPAVQGSLKMQRPPSTRSTCPPAA